MNLNKKNVLVTGGAGFIGSTLVRELLKEKAKITVLDNLFSGDLNNLKEVKDKINFIQGDILDRNLDELMKKNNIDYVFNLAAEPYIPDCYERPHKFFEVNANGALNVFLSAKKAKVKKIIQYSTSEVYGTAITVPMNENHPTLPRSTYAVSKLAADRLAYTLFHEQKIPIVIMRQFNVYGPRETQPYVIPEIISQLSKSNKIKLGNINATRDFTYVSDAAKAAITLLKTPNTEGEVFNVGCNIEYSIKFLAETIGELMNHKKIEIKIDKKRLRPLDVDRLYADNTKLIKATKWKPRVSIKKGLEKTIQDFENHGKKWLWETRIKEEEKMWG